MRKDDPVNDSPPSLSNAEWEVMKPIWEEGPLPARDVFAALPASNEWAYKTVKTLLSRLVAKGALEYEQVGNTYVYRAVYSRDQMTRKEVAGFLDRVLDGTLSPVLAHFIESTDLTDEEIDRLRALLDRKRRAAESGKKEEERS